MKEKTQCGWPYKVACFLKKVYHVFNMNSSLSELGSTRRAINCTGLSHPLRVP
jgi:hypothetical protein